MQNRHFLSETNVISILFSVFSEQENSKYAIKDMLHILHIHNTHILTHTYRHYKDMLYRGHTESTFSFRD